MQEELVQDDKKKKMSIQRVCQLIASLSWFASIIAYGSFELGDCLQLLAALAWTVANMIDYYT